MAVRGGRARAKPTARRGDKDPARIRMSVERLPCWSGWRIRTIRRRWPDRRQAVAGTPFRPHDGPWRDSAVLAALAQLWEEAEQAGASLSQARLSKAAGVPRATLNGWATGRALPRDPTLVDAVARVLAGHAKQAAPVLQVWEQLVTADTARRPVRSALGQPITGLDPFVLEVHRLVEADSGAEVLPRPASNRSWRCWWADHRQGRPGRAGRQSPRRARCRPGGGCGTPMTRPGPRPCWRACPPSRREP